VRGTIPGGADAAYTFQGLLCLVEIADRISRRGYGRRAFYVVASVELAKHGDASSQVYPLPTSFRMTRADALEHLVRLMAFAVGKRERDGADVHLLIRETAEAVYIG